MWKTYRYNEFDRDELKKRLQRVAGPNGSEEPER